MTVVASNDIIRSFRQGAVGNCASVALIKAAIDVFGLDSVFAHEYRQGTHTAKLRDGTTVTFTDQEHAVATKSAAFVPRPGNTAEESALYDRIYQYANLCFCVMVKKVMEIGEAGRGYNDFDAATTALTDGAFTASLPKRLGITKVNGPRVWMPTGGKKGIVAWRGGHAVFVSHGVYDKRGEPRKSGLFFFPKRMQILA